MAESPLDNHLDSLDTDHLDNHLDNPWTTLKVHWRRDLAHLDNVLRHPLGQPHV